MAAEELSLAAMFSALLVRPLAAAEGTSLLAVIEFNSSPAFLSKILRLLWRVCQVNPPQWTPRACRCLGSPQRTVTFTKPQLAGPDGKPSSYSHLLSSQDTQRQGLGFSTGMWHVKAAWLPQQVQPFPLFVTDPHSSQGICTSRTQPVKSCSSMRCRQSHCGHCWPWLNPMAVTVNKVQYIFRALFIGVTTGAWRRNWM